ncbi:hypothetical protein [Nocardia sp. NPDC005366]|uniref:hypothetical protein n=1 Tax=Nocardia sp. NPDC005366 TaxID=3156878 RepID=UPI0033AF9593
MFTTRKSSTSRRLLAGAAIAGALAAVPVTVAAGPASADHGPAVAEVEHDRKGCHHGDPWDNFWDDLRHQPWDGLFDGCDPWDHHGPGHHPHHPHGLFGSS